MMAGREPLLQVLDMRGKLEIRDAGFVETKLKAPLLNTLPQIMRVDCG